MKYKEVSVSCNYKKNVHMFFKNKFVSKVQKKYSLLELQTVPQ